MVEKEQPLHAEGKSGGYVVEGRWQRGAVMHEDVNDAVEAEEEKHRQVLSVAEVLEAAVVESRDKLAWWKRGKVEEGT